MAWSSFFHVPEAFHPNVRQAILEGNARLQYKPDLLKSVNQIMSGGWYPVDQTTINEASTSEIAAMIRSLSAESFPIVVQFYSRELRQPLTAQNGSQIFVKGTASFMNAVAEIVHEGREARLIELLRRHFGDRLATAEGSS